MISLPVFIINQIPIGINQWINQTLQKKIKEGNKGCWDGNKLFRRLNIMNMEINGLNPFIIIQPDPCQNVPFLAGRGKLGRLFGMAKPHGFGMAASAPDMKF
jgi:hypothetical protein